MRSNCRPAFKTFVFQERALLVVHQDKINLLLNVFINNRQLLKRLNANYFLVPGILTRSEQFRGRRRRPSPARLRDETNNYYLSTGNRNSVRVRGTMSLPPPTTSIPTITTGITPSRIFYVCVLLHEKVEIFTFFFITGISRDAQTQLFDCKALLR